MTGRILNAAPPSWTRIPISTNAREESGALHDILRSTACMALACTLSQPSSAFGDFSTFAGPSSSGDNAGASFGDFGGFMATPTLPSAASPPQPLAPPISSLSPHVGYGRTPVLPPPPGSGTIAPLPPPGSGTISPLPPPSGPGPLPPPSAGMSKSLLDRRLSRPVATPFSPPLARAASVKTGKGKPLTITPPSLDLFNADTSPADAEGAGKAGVEASHTRTRSLLESAQARSGIRWPAPPSPLPEALSPPPDAPPTFAAAGVDLLGGGGFAAKQTMQTFSPPSQPSRALSSPVQALSPPPLAPPPAHKMPPAPLHSLAPPPDFFDAGVEDTPPPTPPKPDFGSFARNSSRPSSTVGSSTFSPPSNSSNLPPTLSPPNSSTLPSAVGISRFPHQSSLPAPAPASRPGSRAAHRSVTMSNAPASGSGSGFAPLLPPPPGGGSPIAASVVGNVTMSPPAMTMTPPTASLSPPPGFALPARPRSALSPPPGFTPSPRNSFISPPPPSNNSFNSPINAFAPPPSNNAFAALPPSRAMSLSPPTRNGSPEDSVPLAALVQQRQQAQQVQSVVKGTGGLSASDLSFFEGL